MIAVTLDQSLHEKLESLREPAEIRDSAGNVVGYYTPASQQEAGLYARARQQFDVDEMKRRKESGGRGYTTAEVIDHIRSLEGATDA